MKDLKTYVTELHNQEQKIPTYKIDGVMTQEYKDWAKENFEIRKAFQADHGSERLVEYNLSGSTLKNKLKQVGNYKPGNFGRMKKHQLHDKFGL